jgi:hypothetical protein
MIGTTLNLRREIHLVLAITAVLLALPPLAAEAQTNSPTKQTVQAKKAAPKAAAASRQKVCAAEWQKRLAEVADEEVDWEPGEEEATRQQFMAGCLASNYKY